MIYQNLEFHNVDHLKKVSGMEGVRLERFPEELCGKLGISGNYNARFRAKRVHGCEIRFVTDALYFDVCLTAVGADVDLFIYCGDMLHKKHTLSAGKCTVIHVEYPEVYKQIETYKLPHNRFASNVWRIQFGMNGYLFFHYLDTYGFGRRPPYKEEKPEIVWAAYGSSITCGSVTSLYSNCYLEQAALRLGYDVMNKGLSGSCMCELEMGEYLAGLKVDVLSLEVGVNMMHPFTADTFEERVWKFLQIVKEKSSAVQIYVMDIFSHRASILKDHESEQYKHCNLFRSVVQKLVSDINDDRVKYISGLSVATDLTYLSTDLLHPSDQGHIRMGENLAKQMEKARDL